MLEARMDTLDAEARRALRAASIFGQTFWSGAITALLGGAARSAQAGGLLLALERGEWIAQRSESRFRGETEYAFRHPLVRDAAYAMLTEEDRRLGHVLAGEWLENAGGDAVALAEHFDCGGEAARAVSFWLRAAQEALEGNGFAEVMLRAERGVAGGAEGETLGHLRSVEAEACKWSGEAARTLELAQQAASLLSEGTAAWAEALCVASGAAPRLGQSDRIVEWAERLVVAFERPERDVVAFGVAAARLASNLFLCGHFEVASGLLVRARMCAATSVNPTLEGFLRQAEAVQATFAGDAGSHAELVACTVLAFERAGRARNACSARANHAYALNELGRFDEAAEGAGAAAAEAKRLGLTYVRAVALQNLGWALARTGRLDEASTLVDEVIQMYELQGDRRMEGASRIYAAVIARDRGDLEAAETSARRAAALLENTLPMRAYALAILAEVLHRRGDAPSALTHAREAKSWFEAHGAEEGDAFVQLVHAEMEHAYGDAGEAREAMRASRERLLERASKISSPEARESFLTKVPEHARTLTLAHEWLG
jgi:tetratricopeptide (TPR) repeat protein